MLTSITAGSLVGRFGGSVQRFARDLIEAEMVHNVASDSHDPDQRPPSVAEELREAGLEELGEWLTEDVPSAILAGEESLPARPLIDYERAGAARDSWWRRGPIRRAW